MRDRIYPLMMRHLLLPAINQFTRVKVLDAYRRQMDVEQLDRPGLERLQGQKLGEILQWAYDRVPFYRNRFEQQGLARSDLTSPAALSSIPPTTKEDLMLHFPEGVTASGTDRRRWKYVATSGTHRHMVGLQDYEKTLANRGAMLRELSLAGGHRVGQRWMELRPRGCTETCGTHGQPGRRFRVQQMFRKSLSANFDDMVEQIRDSLYARRQQFYRRVSLPPLDAIKPHDSGVDDCLRTIGDYRPNVFEALPAYLHAFAAQLKQRDGAPPSIGIIKPFGGSLTAGMRADIATAFQTDVYDKFGTSELGMIACDCRRHEGLHLFMDLFHIEICRNGRPVAPGELGRVYITDLENRAMPWIKYELGDVGRYFDGDHGCGRHSLRFSIEGRVHETIVNSADTAFSCDRVYDWFQAQPSIERFQLVEKSHGNFELLYIPRDGHALDEAVLAREFSEFLQERIVIRAYPVKSIRPEESGKFEFVRSASYGNL